MKKSLVIVESPSKAKTIHKFLGDKFTVKASVGHIRNLPEDRLGVDIEGGFRPEYVTIKGKQKIIKELKSEAKKAEAIYIATDPDREGEAIAWHIAQEIGGTSKIHRALFNEVTQNAVQNAIKNSIPIDKLMVDAQQARRVLDRLVGYMVSPFLWKTIFKGSLSAGRVQSVALMLVCEREDKIQKFVQEEYWTIHVKLNTPDSDQLIAKLIKNNGKKVEIHDEKRAKDLELGFKNETFQISKITKKKVNRNPLPPFITSSLQQEASTRLGFSPSRTMVIAQQLYEGLELGSDGSVGLITYMRTDSMRIGKEALEEIRNSIKNKFGGEYLPSKAREFKTKSKSKIQDAHECIRPTYFDKTPGDIKSFLTGDQLKLYTIIWNRTLASQMNPSVSNQTSVFINAGQNEFQAIGTELVFSGFLKVWQGAGNNDNDNEDDITKIPPGLEERMILDLENSDLKQHFTKPPPRFSDSSLVKELEQLGIGRPSTYALIVSTLSSRKYVVKEKKKLIPTELGQMVKKIVYKGFPDTFDVNFTARMETELDQIASGKKNYFEVIEGFYKPFQENLDRVFSNIKSFKQEISEKAGFDCDLCGNDMIIKWGKNGKFYACSAFPDCKNTRQIETQEKQPEEKADFKCEKCGSDMIVRAGRYGDFYGCSNYPECKNIVKKDGKQKTPPEKAGFQCEKCGKDMVVRTGKRGKFYACSGFPKCRNIVNIKGGNDNSGEKTESEKAGFQCEKCSRDMIIRTGKHGKFYACSGYPECKNTQKFTEEKNLPVNQ
ncbi:type I DNA topoisomerase [candidate division KSB1 bacterium]|nr:type I DNA topoisomerase [candidate division KSB1 bacterium]